MHLKVAALLNEGKDDGSIDPHNEGSTEREAPDIDEEIEDEEDEYYTEDEDHIHGDSEEEEERKTKISRGQENYSLSQGEPGSTQVGADVTAQVQGHARLSFHLRSMVGQAKCLAASSSAESPLGREMLITSTLGESFLLLLI